MKKVLHIKSKVVENNLPKLPNYDQILYGEIAINYKDGYETLSIRNDADEVVTFSCDSSIIKLIQENSIVPSSGLTKINDNEVIVKLGDYLEFDQNSGITLVIDDELNSGSTNPISNSAITKVIYDNELVVSSALNDLEENKQNKLVAGNGISISDDVISYTGESQSVTAGSGVTITNGSINVKLSDDLKFDSNSALSVNTDSQLSLTSNKPISNSAVTSALNAKQDAVTFESGLTANNGKVSVKLGSGLSFDTNSGITVNTDNALSTTSNNLVPNSVITNAINSKQNTLNMGSGVSITNDTINVKLGSGISFDANSALTVDSMTIDDELNIQSTNPVSNSAITQAILDNEEVTSSALNDLRLNKQDVLTAGNGISIANNVVSYTGQSQSLNAGSGVSISNDTINVKLGDGIAFDANSALTVNVSSQFVDATGDTMSGKLSITNGGIEVTGDSKFNGTLSATTININDINGTNVNGTNVSGTTVKGNTISAGTYTNLPTASTTTFGVMKVGNGLNVTNGVVSVASVDGDYVNATGDTMSGKLSITNGGLDVSGNTNINGTLSATSINTPNLSITNVSGTTVKGSTVSATTYNNLPTATTTNYGVVKVGSGINVSNGSISVDDEYENVIETVKVNNTAVSPDANKTINIEVPTSLSDLSDDATHRLVTDTEKSTWNGKVDKANAISALTLSLNTTDYKLTLSGTRADGTNFTVSDVVDLPLESVVVGGSYDAATKKVILTLQNGNTIDFSVADLVSGLQTEITSTNKLSADLISDGTTNKTVTASEKNTWNNKQDAITDLSDIRRGAELGETALQTSGGTVNGTLKVTTISATTYNNLPTATTTNFGVVKVGSGLDVTNGTISVDGDYENTIETVKVNGTALTPDANKAVNVEVPTKVSDLTNDSGFITGYTETDPTVPAWAKAATKPTYTASEVGALPDTTVIPTALSDLTDDTTHRVVTDTEKAAWNSKGTYSKPTGGIPATDLTSAVQTSLGKADTAVQRSGDTMSGKLSISNGGLSVTGNSNVNGTLSATTMSGTTVKGNTVSAGTYNNLPSASTTSFGVVKVGSGLNVSNGTISVSGSYANVIEGVKVNGTALTPDASKSVNVNVPTKVSDLTNDSGFITGFTETDPIFLASAAHGITNEDITNWNNKEVEVFTINYNGRTWDFTSEMYSQMETALSEGKLVYVRYVQTQSNNRLIVFWVYQTWPNIANKLYAYHLHGSNTNSTISIYRLTLNSDGSVQFDEATGNLVSDSDITNWNSKISSSELNTVLNNYLPLSGGTMTGKLSVTSGGIEVTGNSKVNGTLSATTFSGTTIKGASISGTSVSGGTVSGTTVKGATISAATYQNLPLASSSTTGVMKVSSGLVVSDGAVSVSTDYAKRGMSPSGSSVPIKYGTWSKVLKTSSYGVVLIYIRINESSQANHRTFMFTPSYLACRLYQLTAENYRSGNPKYQIRAVLTPGSNSSTYDIEINEPAWGGHAEGVNKNIWISWTVLGNNNMTVTPYTTFTEGSGTVYTNAFESIQDADIVGAKIYGIGVSATTVSGTTVKGDTVSAETYQNLPTAATNQFGIMKIGNGLSGSNGTVSVSNYNSLATLGHPSKTAGVPIEIGKWCKVARLASYGSALLSVYVGQTSQSIAYTFNATNSHNYSSLYQLSHGHYASNQSLGVRLTRVGTVTTDFEVYLPYGAGGATSVTIYLASTSLSANQSETNTPTVTPYTAITEGASSGATNSTEFTASDSIDINHARISARYLRSDVADGTQPLVVSSTTLCNNLNADMLDGYHATDLSRLGWVTTSNESTAETGCSWFEVAVPSSNYALYSYEIITKRTSNNRPLIAHYKLDVFRYSDTSVSVSLINDGANYLYGNLYKVCAAISNDGKVYVQHGSTGTSSQKMYIRPIFNPGTVSNTPVGSNSYGVASGFTAVGTVEVTGYIRVDGTSVAYSGATKTLTPCTRLAESRTLWGQPFNGEENVSGNMTGVGSIAASDDITVTKSGTSSATMRVVNGNGAVSLLASVNRGVYDIETSKWVVGTNGTNTFLMDGNVGINTTSPSYQLHVSGDTKSNRYRFSADTTYIGASTTQAWFTLSGVSGTQSPLIVEYTTGGTLNVRRSGNGIGSATTLGTSNYRWRSVYSVSGNFSSNVVVSGDVTAKGAMYSSDRRLKDNIEPISVEDINKLDNVDIVKFNFKSDENKTTKYGVIAQDVEKAGLNNLVGEDENGSKSVDYISLLMLQIEKLNRKIDDMEKKHKQEIDELKNKIDELSSKK